MSLALETAQTIRGVAGTAAAITYTLFGDEITGTPPVDAFKVLAQGQLPSSPGTLYTVPASTQALVKKLTLANTTGDPVTGVKLFAVGTAAGNQITGSFTIPANGLAVIEDGALQVTDAAGALLTTAPVTLTGDVTGSGTGSIVTTLANSGPGAVGPFGTAGRTPVITTDAKGRVATLTDIAITPAGIGAPSGSGTSSGANTGDETAAGILAKLLTVDGPGSGLDADTLDGTSSAGFVPSARALSTTAPLTGGGDLSANRTLAIADQAQTTFLMRPAGAGTGPPSAQLPSVAKTALAITDADVDFTEGTSQVVGTQANFNINLNRYLFNLLNYIGASFTPDDGTGTGGTDVGAPFNVISALLLAAKGGKIVIPGGLLMRQTTAMLVNYGIEVEGGGCGYNADVGNFRDALGCAFIWRGIAGQIQMDVYPSATGGSAQNLKGFHLHGLSFDGRDYRGTDVGSVRADKALRLRSCAGWSVHDIFVQDCVTAHIELNALAPGTIGEAHDCTRGELHRFGIRAIDGGGAGGTVPPGIGIIMSGSTNANTCFNEIYAGQISYVGSNTGKPAIDMVNTDSNLLRTIAINNAGGGLTNWGMVIRGGATAVEASRANRIENVAAGSAGLIECGTAGGMRPDGTADASFNFASAARDNHIDLNTENGEPPIYRGTGVIGPAPGNSGGSSFPNGGFRCGLSTIYSAGSAAAIANTLTQALGMTIPKWFLYQGREIEFLLDGLWTNTALNTTSTLTMRANAGSLGANIAQSLAIQSGATARTNIPFSARGLLRCETAGAAGTLRGSLQLDLPPAATATDHFVTAAGVTGTIAINTLVPNVIELAYISGLAANSITPTIRAIKVLA